MLRFRFVCLLVLLAHGFADEVPYEEEDGGLNIVRSGAVNIEFEDSELVFEISEAKKWKKKDEFEVCFYETALESDKDCDDSLKLTADSDQKDSYTFKLDKHGNLDDGSFWSKDAVKIDSPIGLYFPKAPKDFKLHIPKCKIFKDTKGRQKTIIIVCSVLGGLFLLAMIFVIIYIIYVCKCKKDDTGDGGKSNKDGKKKDEKNDK